MKKDRLNKLTHKIIMILAITMGMLSFSSCVIVHPYGWHRGYYWHDHEWHEHRDWDYVAPVKEPPTCYIVSKGYYMQSQ
jgi:hypothetical protein